VKTLKELNEIRAKALDSVNLCKQRTGSRVVVGMATCGIAAGARPVLMAFIDEVARRALRDVTVTQTGCIGVCRLEPLVEVYLPGEDKVTYVNVKPEQVARIVSEHIVNGNPVDEWTIGAADGQ
jgi:NADP-reducing hydrogenase subunit HndB